MRQFLFLLVAISSLSYGVSLSSVVPRKSIPSNIGTPTVTSTPLPFINPTLTPKIELVNTPSSFVQPVDITRPKLEVFIRVPSGTVTKPYVILSGHQSFSGDFGSLTISGNVQGRTFTCPTSPCAVEFPDTAQITFRAQNSAGDLSDEVQANILVKKLSEGYSITIISLGKFVIFSDSCANIWKNGEASPPEWAKFPQDPGELNTEKSLHYLVGQLLKTGVVNANDCPGGGWISNAPNACGLAKAKDQMTLWQNQYDLNIWLVGRDQHIPPIVLKTLLEIESQFWPTSQRLFLDELGLGQINQLGIDVLLRTNPALYLQVCTSALYRCDRPYESLSGIDRALIRGTLAQSLDAACPTCLYGVNTTKASQSIPLIAKVLYANCVQANEILKLHQFTANYEDSWKFTLVSYHSGFGCLQSAIERSENTGTRIDWNTVASNLECQGAVAYIDKFWGSLLNFNRYIKKPSEMVFVKLQIPTPAVLPTVVVSNSRVLVKIFVDKNGDGTQQADEAINDVQVNLDLENGLSYTQVSKNGVAVFDLSGISIGVKGKINLPGLYRSAPVQVPNSDDVTVIFIFSNPNIPTRQP